ncbi:alpha/beta hydrolase [Polyangium sorediatum]|uniref:PhoPQ-activated protein PqaA family protein n=1 Tax=Polyangium sorediatum TaxID=889274 RepID=A0ABT6NZE0_9BACT|nr:alpha/beta family hydrolase [Polyangium sorediatum]MDI1433720.1 PhoPQ-activated protein PqaA family protein [Polyangium sorediatum]
MRPPDGTFFLPGPAGRIEAVLRRHPSPRAAAVVCHPHPHSGGTLYNKVVSRATRALHAAGATVLRFHFRGVEASEGHYDGGAGEVDDARAAIDFLAPEHPHLLVAGYSFGAWVGLRAGAADPRVKALIGVGIPINVYDFSYLRETQKPLLLVQGEHDEWGNLDVVRAFARELPGPVALEVIPGANHSLAEHLETMVAKISDFVARRSG